MLSLWPFPGTTEKQPRRVKLASSRRPYGRRNCQRSIIPWRRIPFCVRSSYRVNPQKPLLGFTRLFSGSYFRRSQRPPMEQDTPAEMRSAQSTKVSCSVTSLPAQTYVRSWPPVMASLLRGGESSQPLSPNPSTEGKCASG